MERTPAARAQAERRSYVSRGFRALRHSKDLPNNLTAMVAAAVMFELVTLVAESAARARA